MYARDKRNGYNQNYLFRFLQLNHFYLKTINATSSDQVFDDLVTKVTAANDLALIQSFI